MSKLSKTEYEKIEDDGSEHFLGKRPSVLLPHLQNIEKKFFELVGSGEVMAVKDFLDAHEKFNINCVNFQGISALQIAVKINSEEMVQFLLSQGAEIGDCALHAVKENVPQILELILNNMESGLEFTGCAHSSDFPDYITPIILAAQCGHYEIIEMLIERGHTIVRPHKPDCKCKECLESDDDLLHTQTRRIDLYKAITNPAYICHSSDDPILTAFVLSYDLRQCAHQEPEFRVLYREISDEVARFAVDLIGYCRSTEEMELVLKQPKGLQVFNFIYPRLILAMDYKQKDFVSHPNTQQILESAWLADWQDWKMYSDMVKYLYILSRILILPVITLMSVFLPKHKLVRQWSSPLNKMISHVATYFIFLVLIFLQSNIDKTGQKRGMPHSGFEPVIMVFTLGYTWSVLRTSAILGVRRYFKLLWSWYDLIMLSLFFNTYLYWFFAYLDVQEHNDEDLERKFWHFLDPTLIAEGLFAIGTIMAFFRLIYLFQINYHLGPLQISLGKMSIDIAKYLGIFTLIIISFSAGLCRLYQSYDGMVQVDHASGIKTVQQSSFVNFASTLKTLFWALFCMSPIESADVVIENLPGENDEKTIINKHIFTEAVGYIAFACFEVLCVIIILNMLIATMSNTFQKVTDNVIAAWTFGRSEVYIQYMMQTTLPVPLNLIPTIKGIGSAIEWLSNCCKKTPGKTARCNFNQCCFIEYEHEKQSEKDYPVLMAQLAQRYFRCKNSPENADDMEILRQEVNELRGLIGEMHTQRRSLPTIELQRELIELRNLISDLKLQSRPGPVTEL